MATDAPVETDSSAPAPAPAPAGKGNMMKFGIILVVAMAAEAGALLFFNSGSDANADSAKPKDEVMADDGLDGGELNEAEVNIGDFNTAITQGASGGTIHVRFKLSATVSANNVQKFKEAVSNMYESRVREAVIEVCRGSSRSDLSDSELKYFKRRIRDRVNKILRQSLIIKVVISDFHTMEQ